MILSFFFFFQREYLFSWKNFRVILTHFFHHSDHQALLEATKLATIPPAFVNGASFLGQTHVFRTLLHGPLEKSFAALAGTNAVVLTRCRVAAHGAKLAGARRCSLVAGSTSRRWRADGAPCATATTARLRGFRAPTTVDERHKHLCEISLETIKSKFGNSRFLSSSKGIKRRKLLIGDNRSFFFDRAPVKEEPKDDKEESKRLRSIFRLFIHYYLADSDLCVGRDALRERVVPTTTLSTVG